MRFKGRGKRKRWRERRMSGGALEFEIMKKFGWIAWCVAALGLACQGESARVLTMEKPDVSLMPVNSPCRDPPPPRDKLEAMMKKL